jgi:hypothetical protein
MSFEATSNFEEYKKYQELKKSLILNYKGIDLIKVVAFELFNMTVSKNGIKSYKFLFLPFLRIDCSKFAKALKSNSTLITSLFNDRPDYLELLEGIQRSVERSEIVQINPHKISFRLNLKATAKCCSFFYHNPYLGNYGICNKAYLILRTIYACHLIDDLDKTFHREDLQSKNYIPFNSAVGIEVVLTQYFNKEGANTFHIFHGLFGRYKLSIANDIINGENITAKKILSFGETTRGDLINDFLKPQSDVLVAGNPKFPAKKISVKSTFKRCIVLNGFGYYDKDSEKLFNLVNQIAAKREIVFDIKPHPSSKITEEKYKNKFWRINFLPQSISLRELLKQGDYDFAITLNTVTYYECLYYDLICLRYGIGENLNFIGLDDRFYDEQSMIEKINELKSENLYSLNSSIESLLKNTLGMGINNYNKLIYRLP